MMCSVRWKELFDGFQKKLSVDSSRDCRLPRWTHSSHFNLATGLVYIAEPGFQATPGSVGKGAITISTQNINNDWLRMKTWIIWHKRSLSGITNLVWDPAANELFPTVNPEYIGYRERQPFRSLPALGIITSRTTPTEDLTFDMARFTYPLLQFWTLALFYKIGNIDVFKAHGDILAEGGTVCGQCGLMAFEETTFFESEGMFEVILLSECVPDLYNVMLLEWNAGVAERRGIGTIKLSAIDKSFPPGPVWKEIILA